VTAIVEAFRSHRVVAVMAGHGEARGYALGLSLVRDPRFIAVVNDIVIEEGSARYQDVADRFVRGDEVPQESLSQIWRNTTQPGLGLDRPWTEFFHAVRSVNGSIPREHWRTLRAEDQFDAVLYPGPAPSPIVGPSPERCANKADIDEHVRRMALGGPPQLANQLRQFCATVTPK
jgi:hypothetical protein